jgi:hypothetical protein
MTKYINNPPSSECALQVPIPPKLEKKAMEIPPRALNKHSSHLFINDTYFLAALENSKKGGWTVKMTLSRVPTTTGRISAVDFLASIGTAANSISRMGENTAAEWGWEWAWPRSQWPIPIPSPPHPFPIFHDYNIFNSTPAPFNNDNNDNNRHNNSNR